MAELANREQLKQRFQQKLDEKRQEDADRLTAEHFKVYLSALPSSERVFVGEDKKQHGGHIFEVWLSAMQKAGVDRWPLTARVFSRFQSARSRDKKAAGMGRGSTRNTKHTTRVRVSTNRSAKFIETVERGGSVWPGKDRARRGRKLSEEVGKLYGRRSTAGQGWLMFRKGGKTVFRKIYRFSGPSDGVGAFSNAKAAVASLAHSLGWVPK